MERGKPIVLNMETKPRRAFRLLLDVTVGGDDLEDAVDAVKEMIGDHAEELFVDRLEFLIARALPEWRVHGCGDSFEVERHSPAGEDVVVSLSGSTLSDVMKDMSRCYDDFDSDDHAAQIYHAKHYGTEEEKRFYADAPGSLERLINDAHAIDTMYFEAFEALRDAAIENGEVVND